MVRYSACCFQKALTPTGCYRTVNNIPPNSPFPKKRFLLLCNLGQDQSLQNFSISLAWDCRLNKHQSSFCSRGAPRTALQSCTTTGCSSSRNKVQGFIFYLHCTKQDFCSLLVLHKHMYLALPAALTRGTHWWKAANSCVFIL